MTDEYQSKHDSGEGLNSWRRRLASFGDTLFLTSLVFAVPFAFLACLAALYPAPTGTINPLFFVWGLLYNCNPFFSTSMTFAWATGIVYLILRARRIPARERIQRDAMALAGDFYGEIAAVLAPSVAEQDGPSARTESPSKPAGREMSPAEKFAQELAKGAVGPAGDSTPQAPGPASSGAQADKPQPGSELPASNGAASHGESVHTPEPPDVGASIERSLHKRGVHDLLTCRVLRVLTTLVLQGPEAARAENQLLSDLDEGQVALELVPAQWCEWLLPLLGFLGTVWGLHIAIPPLSDGVKKMMDALGVTNAEEALQIRNAAMDCFKRGFMGLRTAFDTTFVGLVGVICVGSGLFYLRRRAVDALGEVYGIAENLVRTCPVHRESTGQLLSEILRCVRAGLTQGTEEQPQPLLGLINATIGRGLMGTVEGQKEPVPLVDAASEKVARAVREAAGAVRDAVIEEGKKMIRQTSFLGQVDLNQLHEARFQTFVLSKLLAGDVRALLQLYASSHGADVPPHPPWKEPTISAVCDFPSDNVIHALAVSNGGTRVCAGGTRRKLHNFVQETLVSPSDDGYNLNGGIRFDEHAVHDSGSIGNQNIPTVVQGLMYDPEGRALLVLCTDGTITEFRDGGMNRNPQPLDGLFLEKPFAWLSDNPHPLVGTWQQTKDLYKFAWVSAGTGAAVAVSSPAQNALDGLSCPGDQYPRTDQVKSAYDGSLICISANKRVSVLEWRGAILDLVARAAVDQEVVALDISADRRFAVLGLGNGGVYRWAFDENGTPVPIGSPNPQQGVTGLFLGESGSKLAVLSGPIIVLYDLSKPSEPRLFNTHGAHVAKVAVSRDRNSLVVATDDNRLMLFSFGLKI